ncbi:hypothetical protein D3C78_1897520 [compost metagenome]
MPEDLQQLAGYMRQHYTEARDWWDNPGLPDLQDAALPDDLLEGADRDVADDAT